jgi:hypothetical protein
MKKRLIHLLFAVIMGITFFCVNLNELYANRVITKNSYTIHHIVDAQKLLVECVVPSVTFTGRQSLPKAHIEVIIDNKKVAIFHQSAFVIDQLEKGVHQVLIIIAMDDDDKEIKKSFSILIR